MLSPGLGNTNMPTQKQKQTTCKFLDYSKQNKQETENLLQIEIYRGYPGGRVIMHQEDEATGRRTEWMGREITSLPRKREPNNTQGFPVIKSFHV